MREAMPFAAHFLPQQTERLTLRRFIDSDLDRFLAYRHDPVVVRLQSWSMLSEDEAIASNQCQLKHSVTPCPGT